MKLWFEGWNVNAGRIGMPAATPAVTAAPTGAISLEK
jgi:hypothetical protein